MPSSKRTLLADVAAVVLLAAVAIFFRFWMLDSLPPGFNHDEAYDALDGLAIARGEGFPVFYPTNFGREALFMYFLAASQGLLGATPFAARSAAAVAGLLAVLATYFYFRAAFSRPAGLFAGLALATSLWHVMLSRIAQRLILLPLFEALSLWLAVRAVRTGRWYDFALAGAALGLTIHTYLASRLFPFVILAGLIGIAVAAGVGRLPAGARSGIERWIPGIVEDGSRALRSLVRPAALAYPLAAFLVFAPLGWYFLQHPEAFLTRIGQVVATADAPAAPDGALDPGSIRENPGRTAEMFLLHGDENQPANLPGRPAFDPLLGAAFLAGLAGILLGRAGIAGFLVPCWLVVMSLPSALSLYAPNFQRAVGAVPAAAGIAGLGLAFLVGAVGRFGRVPRLAAWAASLAVLAFSAYSTYNDYFGAWADDARTERVFLAGLYELGLEAAKLPKSLPLYSSPLLGGHATLRYVTGRDDIRGYDGRYGYVLPPADAAYMILVQDDRTTEPALGDAFDGVPPVEVIQDPFAQVIGVLTRVQGAPKLPAGRRFDERFAAGPRLTGAQPGTIAPGQPLPVSLIWSSAGPTEGPYVTFVQLLGPERPDGGRVWAQHDAEPLGGSFPTTAWRPGETIVERIALPLPSDLPPGQYELVTGLYERAGGKRSPVGGPNSAGDLVALMTYVR